MKRFFILMLLTVLVSGCTMPGPYMSSGDVLFNTQKNHQPETSIVSLSNPSQYPGLIRYFETPYEYRVGSYDVLGITVLGHPELSSAFNTSQIALIQPGQASNQYLPTNNQQNFASQDVGYYVDTQGSIIFPLIGNVHVAGLTTLQIRTEMSKRLLKYIRSPIVNVKVLTFNSQRVHVLGEVMQPGMRPLGDRALSVLDAISLAGGINSQSADMRHVFVLRGKEQHRIMVYWIDAKTPSALIVADHFRLVDNDIVYIPPAGVTNWNRFLNQILPTIQTFWYTRSLIRN